MKKYYISLLLLISIFCSKQISKADEFELMQLKINFNDVISSGQNIIAYGNSGNYLISTDKGNKWNQYNISGTANISQLVNRNDTISGILEEGFIIRSFDN